MLASRIRFRFWWWWVLWLRPLFFAGRWCRFRWRRPVLLRPGFLAVWGVPLVALVLVVLFVVFAVFVFFVWGPTA